jgi:hypothetical protein
MGKPIILFLAFSFFACKNTEPIQHVSTIRLMKKEINIDSSAVLLDDKATAENLQKYWIVKTGEWKFNDGWYEGKNPDNSPGMIISKENYLGDVMIEFEARNALPSKHDIDVMVSGSWNDSINKRDTAYVAGLQGWWEGKIGIERSPEYILNAGTPLYMYEAGHIYHIIMGNINGHVFIWADGKLLIELMDPNPIDSKRFGKVGFEAYASWIQIRNIKVRQISWNPLDMKYDPEF